MGFLSRHLRVPRPARFFGVISLSTGVEMISITLIFNKLTGFYGLLAILTGLRLSSLQLTMYIYSCFALIVLVYLTPHIRKQSTFECMLFGYFYFTDTVVSTLFTIAFSVDWFLKMSNGRITSQTALNRSAMISSAGPPNPIHNASFNETIVKTTQSTTATNEAIIDGIISSTARQGIEFEEIIPSFALVVALTIIRIYFVFVILAYIRQVLRRNAFQLDSSKLHLHTDGCTDILIGDNSFVSDNIEAKGWKGKIERMMVTWGEHYWTESAKTNEAWAKGLDNRFRTPKSGTELPGTIERERRARSGTGPPTPLIKP